MSVSAPARPLWTPNLSWSTLQTLQQRDVVVYLRSVSTYVVTGLVLVISALMIRSNWASQPKQ